jgi:hypothetical protein
MKAIQNGASDIFNLVVNSATVTMIPWFFYGNKTGLNTKVEIYPGKGVPVDDPSQVVFARFQNNPQAYQGFIDLFITLWERVSSIGDLQLGRPAESRKPTATEIMSVIQEGNIKHNYQAKVFREDFIDLVKTIYDLYYQNMPFDKQFMYHGQPVAIPRSLMQRGYKFKLTGSTEIANKLIERKENEDFYGMLRGDDMIDPVRLIADLVKAYKPEADPTEYINPQINQLWAILQENPEIMQVIQKYMNDKMQIAQEIENAGNVPKQGVQAVS